MKILTVCSGCMTDLVVDEDAGTVTALYKEARHIPRREVAAEITTTEQYEGDLLMWECPIPTCGYADSYDLSQHED